MLRRISRHVGYSYCDSIAHSNNTELGNRVLLKVFGDEFGCVSNSECIAVWSEIFLYHCEGEVENKDEMANYSSLKGCGIP